MSPSIFQSTTIPILQEVINFAESRHAILAGNIANLDTPGYRVRDLSPDVFQQRLREAIETRSQNNQPLSPGLAKSDPGDAMRRVRESAKTILYHDDSNVGIEQQVLALSHNQFTHNMAISIMNSQFRLLQAAISERI